MSSEDEFPAGELGAGQPNDPSKKEGDEQVRQSDDEAPSQVRQEESHSITDESEQVSSKHQIKA